MIKRYTVNVPDVVSMPWGDEIETGASIEPDTHFGEWVKYEDHERETAALAEELAALRARVIELEALVGAGALTIDAQARKDCEDNAGGWGGDEGERDE